MNLLLDSHVWLWFAADDPRLSAAAKLAIESPAHNRFISIASIWELSLKLSLGKLRLSQPFNEFVAEQMLATQAQLLPIEVNHCLEVISLPMHHRDPFDRMLIVQAKVGGLVLVTADHAFEQYPIQRLW